MTGAGSDIGQAVCLALSDQGARVRATDLDRPELSAIADRIRDAVAIPADLTSPAEIASLAREPVDILVSVAGIAHVEPFLSSDPDLWELMWKLNLRAPMLLTRELAGGMTERGWGRLVYICTDSARAGAGGETAYSATKAGLFGLAKSVAREVALRGVTSNVVCPGVIDTSTSRAILRERQRMREALMRAVPIGRLGLPEEIAGAVAYLCSPQAGYTTGQVLSVDGGLVMA